MTRAMKPCLRDLETPVDLVIPVPLSNMRLFKRGYNQAALLARPIAKHLNAPMATHLIARKHRRDMGHMTFKQRRDHIRGVFRVIRPDAVRGKTILLVDDVMTSGATLGELNKVLKKAGAAAVYGIVFCRVVRAI
jgi:ComF family protein